MPRDLQFTLRKDANRDKSSLRLLLEAHDAYEQMSAARSFYVHMLALVSGLVWLGVCWPWFIPAAVQMFAIELWGVVLFIVIVAGAEERRWYRRRARYLTDGYSQGRGTKSHS